MSFSNPFGDFDMQIVGESQDASSILVSDVEFSKRARTALSSMGIKTLGDITGKSLEDFMGLKNFGKTSLNEIRDIIGLHGLKILGE